ncbi:DUF3048 domain-containing protein [Butyrivibrio sp. DSM 10294]|uniref:DUF3048 domain-containing protein n=1 Tax=Butyrivibrio sp. DSM 10294 TaxID=2972457 RepID=UPI00234EE093|nr:DUF3048 domain-containing protein [Butyrivibrio sp. DSM 10294]MDC7292926.1 DUF3048 domain-containing protein [Butyrivibrio sp. DSM 10294]
MKRVKALLMAGLLTASIVGCGSDDDAAVTGLSIEKLEDIQEVIPEAPAEEASVEEVIDEDAPPAEGMVRSYFTNEWVDESVNENRPLAVMYPINKEAQPQYGLSNVAVFYEIMEEGSMSRQMGILENWENLPQIGNIRSIRDYFVYAALEYDPVIVHYGGPELYVKTILTRDDVDNLNGVGGVMGSDYGAFFRIPEGSTSEHTAFTDASHVTSAIEKAGFSKTHRDKFEGQPHFTFTGYTNPNTLADYPDAVDATEINMASSFPVTKSALTYDPEKEVYLKTLYGNKQVDALTGEQLAFANVIIQRTYHEVRDDNGYLAYQMHDSTRDGYYITKGKMIHITWSKTDDYSPTTYFDDNGQEITLNTGKTMIFVIQEKGGSFSKFEVNGTTIAE